MDGGIIVPYLTHSLSIPYVSRNHTRLTNSHHITITTASHTPNFPLNLCPGTPAIQKYGHICKSVKMADFPNRNGCVGRNGWVAM